jgi:adenylate cyclase
VVEQIVEGEEAPQIGGAEVEITAFFSDVAAFSNLAECLSPADLVALMCEYLAEGTAEITQAGGTLDKYVGDAIIAMFGAPVPLPDHALAACKAALGLQAAQTRLRRRWAEEGERWPARALRMRTRIGLNTGPAVVGNVGSPLRFNYTMMGGTVNLAQRMESAVGHFGADILVTAATFEAARRQDTELVFRPLDKILVSGHHEAVEVYELIGCGNAAAVENRARLAAYAEARALYREGRWAEARDAFLEAAAHEPSTGRLNPSLVMASRCETFSHTGSPPDPAVPVGKG